MEPGDLVRIKKSRLVISNIHDKVGIFLGYREDPPGAAAVLIDGKTLVFSKVGVECIERVDETR
jgi:hypothetical protein